MNKVVLFVVGIILAVQTYLLAAQPYNTQLFHLLFHRLRNYIPVQQCYLETIRLIFVSILLTGAYSLLCFEQLYFALFSQVLILIFQTDRNNYNLIDVHRLVIQILIFLIIFDACFNAHSPSVSPQISTSDSNQVSKQPAPKNYNPPKANKKGKMSSSK